jgi:hypothetical protein
MKTDRQAKANSQSSAPVTQFYPLPPLTFNSFGVDFEDGCIGLSKNRSGSGAVRYSNGNDARDGNGIVVEKGGS